MQYLKKMKETDEEKEKKRAVLKETLPGDVYQSGDLKDSKEAC